MKLNGWKRVGIVASIAWILGAGIYTFETARDADIRMAAADVNLCEEKIVGRELANKANDQRPAVTREDYEKCEREGESIRKDTLSSDWYRAADFAFIPVPLGWGVVYLVLFVARWVRRGFVRTP